MTALARTADLSREDLLRGLRALRPQFEALGVTAMTLFGSRARGDNRADSDIDLMIEVGEDFSIHELFCLDEIVAGQFGVPGNAFLKRSLSRQFLAYSSPDWIAVY